MRKCASILLASILLLTLSACGDPIPSPSAADSFASQPTVSFTAESSDFTYELDGYHLPAVSDKGILYTICHKDSAAVLEERDLTGKLLDTYDFSEVSYAYTAAFFDDSYCFAAASYNEPDITSICAYDVSKRELKTLCEVENFSELKKIVPANGKLYILGKSIAFDPSSPLAQNPNYNGETVKCVDIQSGEISEPFEGFPLAIAGTDEGNIVFCAQDEGGELYFQTLEPSTGEYGETIYNSAMQTPDDIEMYGSSEVLYRNAGNIKSTALDGSGTNHDLAADAGGEDTGYCFVSKSGYLFYNAINGLRRVWAKTLIHNATGGLTIAYATNLSQPVFSELITLPGFVVTPVGLDPDEFALAILAGDAQYDLYYIKSLADYADNIRKKGAFYPLNNIPAVRSYLDGCFSYVRDAATDEEGNVWMLPVELYADAILYNDIVWEDLGADIGTDRMSVAASFEEFILFMKMLRDEDVDVQYNITPTYFYEKYFYQLIRKHNGFERDAFAGMAEFFSRNMNFVADDSITSHHYDYDNPDNRKYVINGGKTLLTGDFVGLSVFKGALKCPDFDDFPTFVREHAGKDTTGINFTHNRYAMYPPIEGMMENEIYCNFLCLNPNSQNPVRVSEYISALCEYQQNLRNSFILSDRSTYDDRHFINDAYNILSYEHNYIRFSLDPSIIYEDLERYLGDEITLEQYLDAVEFKIGAYLGE